jgi:hypothetical protein
VKKDTKKAAEKETASMRNAISRPNCDGKSEPLLK